MLAVVQSDRLTPPQLALGPPLLLLLLLLLMMIIGTDVLFLCSGMKSSNRQGSSLL